MKLNKYIDHTNLKPTATASDIERLCAEAKTYDFASVCVNPCDVALAKKLLCGTDVKVCTVIGFPLGRNLTEIKVAETLKAKADGCDEFDMVINVGWLKSGEDGRVKDDVRAVINATEGRTVKVILEIGFLTDDEIVRATKLCCEAGADFVKTCTGFSSGVATAHAVSLMKQNVSSGVRVKASAGIRSYADAMAMIEAGADRIGTSAGVAIMEGAERN